MSRVLLVTGSSRGIGEAIARMAKLNGYEVILHGKSPSDKLSQLARELSCRYLTFDLKNECEIQDALSTVGKLDVLINNAGINISKSFKDLEESDWHRIYEINLIGLSMVIKNSIPLLVSPSQVSRIINISSVKGTYSAVGRVAYASSKAALINLTAGLAKEFAPNILVNSVSPGFVKTEMTSSTWSERIKNQVDSILLGRMADPEEIAEVVMFLASEKCTYITGQNIIVDGGFGIKKD